jgi:ABC-type sulfate/molybdate transport systems ATPase subunit
MTFQCISGLLQPDEGYISINDRVIFDSSQKINILPRARKIGYIFQNYALFPHMTVRKNISFGMVNGSPEENEEKVDCLLITMRLSGLGERYPWQLSGGQQQRVALARALAMEPELLLMDEPFSALDSYVKEELESEILEIEQYYKGNIILITHNLHEAYKLSSQIAVYQAGRIVQYDKKQEVMFHPVNKKVAALTGMKNFFEGQITNFVGDKITVRTPLGLILVVRTNEINLASIGENITLGIRPEFISISDMAGENVIECRLITRIEGISSYLYEFKPSVCLDAEYCLRAEAPKFNSSAFQPGGEYFLYLPPERITIMKE